MSTNLVFNPNQTQTLPAPVRTITVATGSVVITDGHEAVVVQEDSSYDAANGQVAGLSVFSPNGARVSVTYSDEPLEEAPVERGDSGGNTGSFESRTVKELRDLAKERGLTVTGKKGKKPVKADFIKALRG